MTIFRGWAVVLSGLCMTLTLGLIYSYSDFFIPLQQEFGWSRTIDSTVPSMTLIVSSFGFLIAAYLMSKFGTRKISMIGSILVGVGTIASSQINSFSELLIFFGIFVAFGSSMVILAGTSLVVQWFVKRRALAVGITASGSGIGTLLIPPIAERFILYNGWRVSLIVLGVGFLVILLLASYFMQTPAERSLAPYGWENLTKVQRESYTEFNLREALTSSRYWIIYSMFALASLATAMFAIHSVPFARSEGIDFVTASEALGIFGAGSLFSRVVIGLISDRLGRARSLTLAFAAEFVGMASVPFIGNIIPLLFLAAFAIGFGYGGYLADLITLTGDIFGMKFFGSIWGSISTGYGIGSLLGPIIAGAYFDVYATYAGAFEIGAASVAIALLLSVYFSMRLHQKTFDIVVV